MQEGKRLASFSTNHHCSLSSRVIRPAFGSNAQQFLAWPPPSELKRASTKHHHRGGQPRRHAISCIKYCTRPGPTRPKSINKLSLSLSVCVYFVSHRFDIVYSHHFPLFCHCMNIMNWMCSMLLSPLPLLMATFQIELAEFSPDVRRSCFSDAT